jgi:hypothetical protein
MVTLKTDEQSLIISVDGIDQLWSFKSEIRVPLAHVAGVEMATDEARQWFHGIRAPGTNVPGIITAGTYYDNTGRVFWDVHHPEKAIAIMLHDERFSRLVVEVADPVAAIAEVQQALAEGNAASTEPR